MTPPRGNPGVSPQARSAGNGSGHFSNMGICRFMFEVRSLTPWQLKSFFDKHLEVNTELNYCEP